MLRKFCRDRRGNYAMLTAIAMLPVMGAVALAVDYSEVSRQRQAAQNALDATNLAIALRYLDGTSEGEVRTFAQEYFEANFRPSAAADPKVSVTFPTGTAAGGTVKVCADLKYDPLFFPVVQALTNDTDDSTIKYSICSEVRLRNTVEVALVLDNSGSMHVPGFGSRKKRIDLLKDAAKQLVDTMAGQTGQSQKAEKPVQFGIVPFSASVNVGPQYESASWMDGEGRSPIHHVNFDWETMRDGLEVVERGGAFRKEGKGWGKQRGEPITRFTLFDVLTHQSCQWFWYGKCQKWSQKPAASWAGCVEIRPYPYGVNDTPPTRNDPATLFVPMFAPDETDQIRGGKGAHNSWWHDVIDDKDALDRQRYMDKYFIPYASADLNMGHGPNLNCTTNPITPLTEVTTRQGLNEVKKAIDDMEAYPRGNTNVPEGLAWGWRVLSSRQPFTEGRDENNRGNDKIVIVLTDGANTYVKPSHYGARDDAHNESSYGAYNYVRPFDRIYDGTRLSGYSEHNYARAMNEHMLQTCANAKGDSIVVITVALDLSSSRRDEREQIESLRECASESKFRTDANGKPIKLFWNTRGGELSDTFQEIADELSNLRLVS